MLRITVLLLAILLLRPQFGFCQAVTESPLKQETAAERDARMRWWRDARFGMFIHWGVYAVPAGEWKGKPVRTAGEWIMNGADIPVPEYEPLAAQFNPVKYDPAEWVRIAKDAGMKYIVITSKHHDGFCLFDTKATDWDVVDATPYGKDLLMPLAEECRKQGLKFCTYYSIMDWHHPAQQHGPKNYNPTGDQAGPQAGIHRLHEDPTEGAAWVRATRTCCGSTANGPTGGPKRTAAICTSTCENLKPELIINNRDRQGPQGDGGP